MNKNKNVSIWRGDTPPPSKFHLWLKNNKLYHNDGIDWIENEIDNASNESDGLMSKEDKERLDNLVYDGLDSNDQNRALSANLGNVLLGKIETIKLSAYKVKGSVENISDIPLVDILLGDVYNILNSFYINNKKYPEGTNVVWTGTQFDPLGGTVDFKDYSTTEQINKIVTTLENNVNNSLDNLNSIKSDKTYVNEQLATKADITYVDNKVSPKADTTYVDNKVSPKADKTYVDTQLATKANITYVDNKILLKADKTYVNEQLATKANTTYVDNKVSLKADKTYVDNKTRNATHIRTVDMQYMGVAFDREGFNDGVYETSVDVPSLAVGEQVDYTEAYDNRGNISSEITLYEGETIVVSSKYTTPALVSIGAIMYVLALPNENGLCIYKCYWDSKKVCIFGHGAEYRIYKNSAVLDLASGEFAGKAELDSVKESLEGSIQQKSDKTYVDTQLATKVDKVAGKGLSSNDFIDRYKFATQTLDEILEKKNETQTVVDITSNFCLGTFGEKESLLNVGAEIPFANHYTFRHKVDKIDGNNQEYIELSCNTYYVDYYTGGSNLKELFIRVPIDEHSYILLHCRQYGDGHGYRWIVKEKIYGTDDVYDTTKIPYLFSPLKYTDDKTKELQSTINTKLQEEITRATNAENNLREDLNQRVHRNNIDTIISEYIESNPINTDKVYWEGENKTQTEFNRDLLSKYFKLDSNLQESVNMLNAKIDGSVFSKDYEATLKYKIGRFDEWYTGGGHSFYADANLSYNTIRIELTKGLSIIIQPAFSCILVSVNENWGTCLATFSKHNTTPYNVSTTGTYYIGLFDSSGYPVSNIGYVATVITSYSSTTTLLENKIYLLEERIAALEGK